MDKKNFTFVFGENGEFMNFGNPPYSTEGVRMLFLGSSGAGKSNFLMRFTEWAVHADIPVLFLDMNGGEEFGDLPKLLGGDKGDIAVTGYQYVSARQRAGVFVVDFLNDYINFVSRVRKAHFLVVDDVDYVVPRKAEFGEWQKESARIMLHLLYNSRKFGVNIVSATNAASRLHQYWLEQQNIRLIGMTSSKSDWSVHKTYLPPSFTMDSLINLNPGEVYISSKRMSPGTVALKRTTLKQSGYTPVLGMYDTK